MIEGALIDQKTMGRGGPVRVEKAKIGLIQFQLSPPKTDVKIAFILYLVLIDGKSSNYFGLRPNGSCLEGRETILAGSV